MTNTNYVVSVTLSCEEATFLTCGLRDLNTHYRKEQENGSTIEYNDLIEQNEKLARLFELAVVPRVVISEEAYNMIQGVTG